ncbi:MAG: hypothetical protein ACXVO1_10605 [Tumebacillaceae bacterium]
MEKAFTEYKSLFWPVVIAIAAGFVHMLGAVVDWGTASALTTWPLTVTRSPQDYIYQGVVAVSAPLLPMVIVAVALASVMSIVRWLIGRLPDVTQQQLNGPMVKRILAVIAFSIVIGVPVALNILNARLTSSCSGMILKAEAQLGAYGADLAFDAGGWRTQYRFMLGAGLVVLTATASWLLPRFRTMVARSAFVSWVVFEGLLLLFQNSFTYGLVKTATLQYPVVDFSTKEQLFGKNSIAALLATDDKQFAVLVVVRDGPYQRKRLVAFLPRSEVKWMTVRREQQLYSFAAYGEATDQEDQNPRSPSSLP